MCEVQFIDAACDFTVKAGVVFISAGSQKIAMSLRDFELGHARSRLVLDEYYAKRAQIIALPSHAAPGG